MMVEEAISASSTPVEHNLQRRLIVRLDRLTYSIEEASRLLGISRSHAYLLTEKGEIPCIRLGMRKRIAGAVIEAIVSGKKFRADPNYRNDNIDEI
jgi:excisionase family DNA binding protein